MEILMQEIIDDYNADYFFQGEEDWITYNDFRDYADEVEMMTKEEEDFVYNILTFEQTISTLEEFKNNFGQISIKASAAIDALNDFIDTYTKQYG